MMLVMGNLQTLPTTVALTTGIIFVGTNLDYAVIFYLHLKATVLGAANTGCFLP